MAVDYARFREFARCQTQVNVAAASMPTVATDAAGMPMVVPPGEVWMIAQAEYINTSTSAGDCYVWIVPPGQSPPGTTETKWLWVPGVSIAAESSLAVEAAPDVPLRRLTEGDAVWIMGGLAAINVVILGWRA